MAKIDYEKYLVRKPNYEAFGGVKNRQSPTMTMMSNKQVPGCNYYMEPGWIYGIPDPNPSIHMHTHNYDEIVMHFGGDYKTPQALGGEVEFYVGGQPIIFNTTSAFYLPKGTPHGRIIWKKFSYPHLQMSLMINPGIFGKESESATIFHDDISPPEKIDDFDYEQYVVRSPVREMAADVLGRTSPALTYMSSMQVPGVKYYIQYGWTFGMPVSKTFGTIIPEMVHKNYDEILLFLGGDSQNPEDLGADIEFYVGGQPLTFNTTSALFIPHGLVHGPMQYKKYRKPHMVIAVMCGAGTLREGWGDNLLNKQREGDNY